MKLIIAGSRHIDLRETSKNHHTDVWRLAGLLLGAFGDTDELFGSLEIVSGGCPDGVDAEAKRLADDCYDVKYREFPADWKTHGKAAGPIRNRQMAAYADALLLIWDGQSRGSASMLEEARKAGLRIVQVIIEEAAE